MRYSKKELEEKQKQEAEARRKQRKKKHKASSSSSGSETTSSSSSGTSSSSTTGKTGGRPLRAMTGRGLCTVGDKLNYTLCCPLVVLWLATQIAISMSY